MPNPNRDGLIPYPPHPSPTRYTQPVFLFIFYILTYLNNLKLKNKNKNTVELLEDAHNLEKRGPINRSHISKSVLNGKWATECKVPPLLVLHWGYVCFLQRSF